MFTRRSFLGYGAALTGAAVLHPVVAVAESHSTMSDVFKSANGEVVIHPVSHASFVMETPNGVIYADPVGGAALYEAFPAPDLILITHHHGDHFDPETLSAINTEAPRLIANPTVFDQLPEALKSKTISLSNGDSGEGLDMQIEAIPAYNLTEERLQYHPKGRDNGYLFNVDGLRVYIAGDTEDIPEMRALDNVDIAFLPMNLPYTMDEKQASSAVEDFAPKVVYPYHYKGSDPELFAQLVVETDAGSDVRMGAWYGSST